ncbi:MAG: penicillin acylase family protein [Phycisphaeraceae bacterium]|nr:penicillin acylase family protein [Phycisphaeraceae bacterium]MCB9848314.1 penicillin acylase family protein [Phycisphaeraceae bacterium]
MPQPRTIARRIRRTILAIVAVALLIAVGLAGYAYSRVVASLPMDSGDADIDGLTAPVEVTFDDRGVPTIRAATLLDAVAAQGFLDAQERYFQMDLARRYAAGELAELFGARALASDRRQRPFRFRDVAGKLLARTPARHRAILEAYANGVNSGLAALGDVPPEYLALRAEPAPWRPEDSILIMEGMAIGLAQDAEYERMIAVMDEALPPELVRFLTPATDRDDAPILNENPGDPTGGYVPMSIPGPDVVDLREREPYENGLDVEESIVGDINPAPLASNNWAIAANKTSRHSAILANDPHLWHSVPNIWRRSRLVWPGGDAVGVNMPGFPGVVIGANEHLAWGFTNTTGDFQDLIQIETDPENPAQYLAAPDGYTPFGAVVETIRVKGGAAEELVVRTTKWGNVIGEDHHGAPLVMKWAALDPELQNLNLLDMMSATTLEEGFELMRTFRSASQNAVLADDRGRIAWVVTGYLPDRQGFSGRAPVSWARDGVGWKGELPDDQRPQIFDPRTGFLATANNRTAQLPIARRIGRAWARPGRARRILEVLAPMTGATEREMLALQLDTTAPRHERWRAMILDATSGEKATGDLAGALAILKDWNGTADADQPAYRILSRFRSLLRREIVTPLVAPCLEIDASFVYRWTNTDEPVLRLVEERPAHLLPPQHANWDALIRDVFATTVAQCAADGGIGRPWGDANRADIEHPMSGAIPAPLTALRRVLDMPHDELPGDAGIVRVSTPSFGASLRLVASPGHLEDAIFHMPCGQSGHPLSPHYRDGQRDWLEGNPSPLLPGATVSTLTLHPAPR